MSDNDCTGVICLILIISISAVLPTAPMPNTSPGAIKCEWLPVAQVGVGICQVSIQLGGDIPMARTEVGP